jgi:hypothetical protein
MTPEQETNFITEIAKVIPKKIPETNQSSLPPACRNMVAVVHLTYSADIGETQGIQRIRSLSRIDGVDKRRNSMGDIITVIACQGKLGFVYIL